MTYSFRKGKKVYCGGNRKSFCIVEEEKFARKFDDYFEAKRMCRKLEKEESILGTGLDSGVWHRERIAG